MQKEKNISIPDANSLEWVLKFGKEFLMDDSNHSWSNWDLARRGDKYMRSRPVGKVDRLIANHRKKLFKECGMGMYLLGGNTWKLVQFKPAG